MSLFKRFRLDVFTWSIPLGCAILGTGLGLSQAMLAGEVTQTTTGCITSDVEGTSTAPLIEECADQVERVLADINGDGLVDAHDLVLLLSDYGSTGAVASDVNDDGEVDGRDIIALVRQLTV